MYGTGPSRDLAAERRARRTEAQRKRRLEQRESTDPEVIAKCQAWAERARQYIRVRRAQETPEEHAARLATRRASRPAQYRAQVNAESAEQRERRLKAARISNRESRKRRAQQNAQHHEFATNISKRKLNSDGRNKRTYAHTKYEFTSWNESRFLHCNADPAAPRTARCVVPVCHSRSAPSSILYPLPAEPSQRQAWIDFVRGCPCGDACDWNPPTNEISFVCSLHFTVRCFRFQRPRGGSAGYRKRLKRGAVPTLYPIEEQCSSTANKNSLDNTAERLHEIKDTVQVTRAQCGGCHVLQQSNSSSPGTSPPSVAWKWPQRLPAVLSGLCPSQCSAVGEWRSSSEILRTESRSQPCVCAPRHYNRPKCLSDCAVLLL
ncbi:uncharacterized protein [Dermacentor andersoni]|uniref:uncharacterized protein isoform X2 n=1 Tax=Dermacentor andersoni TaxID=34620 RepID=UPI00241630A6|nr:uncharacterized protein LOC126526730 isoform X2 [Dermacentor andersoni]